MPGKILLIVDDLFFLTKIQQAAKQANVEVEGADPESASDKLRHSAYAAVILDLNHRSGRAIEVLRALKKDLATQSVLLLGFLSHVQGGLAVGAREAGCDVVIARSAFSQRLPELLARYASGEKPSATA